MRAQCGLILALLSGCAAQNTGEGFRESVAKEHAEPVEIEAGGELYGAETDAAEQSRAEAQKQRMQDDRPGTPEELAALRQLMDRAQEIRGLPFVREVAVRVQSKKGIEAYLRGRMENGDDQANLERAHRRYVALGLLDPKTKVKSMLEDAAKIELLGYYDPKGDFLVLRDDVAYGLTSVMGLRENVEWRSVIVHELVHALQDQHFDMGAALDLPRTTDEQHSYMALVEGDATLAMMQYMFGRVGLKFAPLVSNLYELDRMFNGLPPTAGAGAMASPLAEEPGMFRYRAGMIFAAGVWREGGTRGLDRAFRRPPASTQEVLDPLLFLSGERHARCSLPPLSLLDQAGYRVLEQDTMGRIELSAYLQQGGLGGDLIARTWECDRVAVLERDGKYASVWLIKMMDPDGARAVVARANEGVGSAPQAKERPFLAFQVVDFAIIANNVDAKQQPALKRQLTDWAMSGRAMKH